MNRLLSLATLTFLLAACGSSTTSTTVACANVYFDGTVGTCIPAGWHVVDRGQLDARGVPPEVLVAFQADAPVSGQFATVTVTREPLTKQMTAEEYSNASMQSVQAMPGYAKVNTEQITVDGQKVTMHTFTAQPQADQPKTRFTQVSIVSGSAGYSYTGATPVTVDDAVTAQVQLIVKNATLQAAKQ